MSNSSKPTDRRYLFLDSLGQTVLETWELPADPPTGATSVVVIGLSGSESLPIDQAYARIETLGSSFQLADYPEFQEALRRLTESSPIAASLTGYLVVIQRASRKVPCSVKKELGLPLFLPSLNLVKGPRFAVAEGELVFKLYRLTAGQYAIESQEGDKRSFRNIVLRTRSVTYFVDEGVFATNGGPYLTTSLVNTPGGPTLAGKSCLAQDAFKEGPHWLTQPGFSMNREDAFNIALTLYARLVRLKEARKEQISGGVEGVSLHSKLNEIISEAQQYRERFPTIVDFFVIQLYAIALRDWTSISSLDSQRRKAPIWTYPLSIEPFLYWTVWFLVAMGLLQGSWFALPASVVAAFATYRSVKLKRSIKQVPVYQVGLDLLMELAESDGRIVEKFSYPARVVARTQGGDLFTTWSNVNELLNEKREIRSSFQVDSSALGTEERVRFAESVRKTWQTELIKRGKWASQGFVTLTALIVVTWSWIPPVYSDRRSRLAPFSPIKMLATATAVYLVDNDDCFPPGYISESNLARDSIYFRRNKGILLSHWTETLYPYYGDKRTLSYPKAQYPSPSGFNENWRTFGANFSVTANDSLMPAMVSGKPTARVVNINEIDPEKFALFTYLSPEPERVGTFLDRDGKRLPRNYRTVSVNKDSLAKMGRAPHAINRSLGACHPDEIGMTPSYCILKAKDSGTKLYFSFADTHAKDYSLDVMVREGLWDIEDTSHTPVDKKRLESKKKSP